MNRFAQLYRALDQTSKVDSNIHALVEYFMQADDADKIWVLALLLDKRPKRTASIAQLRDWSDEISNLPSWLFEGCYKIVGDISETISLIMPIPSTQSNHSLSHWVQIIMDLKDKDLKVKKETIQHAWKCLDQDERLLFNKLLTGGLRFGIAQKTVIHALSKYSGVEENKITHRLKSNWDPVVATFDELVLNANPTEDLSKPYVMYKAKNLDFGIVELGDASDWIAERKWDGIKGQLILRRGEYYLWSSRQELVSDKFPELEVLKNRINNDVVIIGEILPFKDGKILNFNILKSRIGKKNVTKKKSC